MAKATTISHNAKIVAALPLQNIAIVIPAYEPVTALIGIARELAALPVAGIVVIDDGSGPDYLGIFEQLSHLEKVQVIRHAVNLGKGAALKTGINYALVHFPQIAGIVTADADGQHDPADVRKVALQFAENPGSLVLGVREFTGAIPLRSRLGNSITRGVMRLVVGQRLSDTQTGLRAIPRGLLEQMLSVPASGYEFELEMLITARQLRVPVIEQPIRTIYERDNPTSHFQPLRDSMRIYFVLLRFGTISATTAALDNVVFFILFRVSGIVAISLFLARALSLTFNYTFVRRAVFLSNAQHRVALPRYLLLGIANVIASYSLISLLTHILPVRVIAAKILAETGLWIANFAIQRDFIFVRRVAPAADPSRKPVSTLGQEEPIAR